MLFITSEISRSHKRNSNDRKKGLFLTDSAVGSAFTYESQVSKFDTRICHLNVWVVQLGQSKLYGKLLGNPNYMVNYWEVRLGVTLQFRDRSSWSSSFSIKRGINSLAVRLIPALNLSITYNFLTASSIVIIDI